MTDAEARIVMELFLDLDDPYDIAGVIAQLSERLPEIDWRQITDEFGEEAGDES